MVDRILVPFEGEVSGTDEFSWGQDVIWRAMRNQDSSLNIGGVRSLVNGESVGDIASELSFMASRHQSLRTRVGPGAGCGPLQVVDTSGEIPLEVLEVGDGDPAEAAAAQAARYKGRDFHYASEWPVRMCVITRHKIATHLAEMYCHLAFDAYGMSALRRDVANRDPRTGAPAGPVTAMQPLEQVRQQRTARGRRHHEAAVRYREHLAAVVPRHPFPSLPGLGKGTISAAFESPACHLAVNSLAASTEVSTSSVILAAYAVAVAKVTGRNPVVVQIVVNNRFRSGFADSVSPLNQACPCVIDVAGASYGEVIVRAWRRAIGAYKHAYYDPGEMEAVVARLREDDGRDVAPPHYFNDRRVEARQEPADAVAGAAEDLRALRDKSTLRWDGYMQGCRDPLFFHVNNAFGTLACELWADAAFMTGTDLEACLHGMEDALIAAALDPSTSTGV
jgi:Condensation domain